jgi:hypothetical protein
MEVRTDAQVIAERFDIPQLHRELHHAKVMALPDWDDYGYWLWYIDVVSEAIELKKATTPKPVVKPGHVDLDALKARLDIVATIENYGISLKKAGHNLKACCPFHDERTPSFVVYPDQNRFHCFGCQAKGDTLDFIQKYEGINFREAVSKC